MCLAVPLKLLKVAPAEMTGVVEMGASTLIVGLDLVPEAKPGNYVLIHAGMAIEVLDEREARETLKLYREYADFPDRLAPEAEQFNG